MTPSERGRKGIRAAIEKDPQHQSKAGKNGFAATVARHWGGDAKSYTAYLRQRAHESQIEALADIQLRGELARGKESACIELPCPDDYEPQTWQEYVTRREDAEVTPW